METSNGGSDRSLDDLGKTFVEAGKKAMVHVIRMHQAFDQPIVEWENGQTVLVDPFDERCLKFLQENSSLRPIPRVPTDD